MASQYGQASKAGHKPKRNDQDQDYAEDDQGNGAHRKGLKGTITGLFSGPPLVYYQEPQNTQPPKQQPEVLRKSAPSAALPERKTTEQSIRKLPIERDGWGRLTETSKELLRHAEYVEELKGHLTQATVKQHALEQELRQLQVASFKNISNARYTPMDDTTIKFELGGIQNAITQIGKHYGADSEEMQDLQTRPTAERDQLHLDLCNVVYMQDAGRKELEEELAEEPHAARVFLTGLLSFAVHHEIISKPFFFLANDEGDKSRPSLEGETIDWAEMFFKAYYREWQVDAHEANIWRSQTIRYLFPPTEENKNSASPLQRFVVHRQLAAGDQAANRFINGCSKLLTRRKMNAEEQKQYCAEVSAVFDHATSLSDLANTKFTADSPELESHPLHLLDDHTDRKLDGKPIRTVVHPSVVAIGTHDGDDYDSAKRVWAKALVCLDP